ncbi:hypothetical protein [Shewanella baltica]|uniref:hypothetical protein n=1 Tax=Shewanella baltica TaxID=62322 RepID=UPI00217E7830|nr:hypothetical protein [Shewanella baltica]MCS6177404.1 hypothetical protein [Shewanella baltica]MCS6253613.1 hypothetical protein [Shewanella baltica]
MISQMSQFEYIISMALMLLGVSAFMGVYFFFLQKKRESRYDEEKKKVELDLLRHNLESQVYELNERSNRNSSKWKDSIHLQIDGTKDKNSKKGSKIHLNDFLKSGGIKESDLTEEDFVFVLTPFHSKYDGVFEVVKSVCEKADIRCIRGDEQNFKGDIFSHVLSNIVKAKVVVANLSGRNPNVLYELGIAHSLDKTTIMVSQLLDDLPVDIKSKRIVTYNETSDLETSLPVELLKAMK